jgi:hypothetical protein
MINHEMEKGENVWLGYRKELMPTVKKVISPLKEA